MYFGRLLPQASIVWVVARPLRLRRTAGCWVRNSFRRLCKFYQHIAWSIDRTYSIALLSSLSVLPPPSSKPLPVSQ